MTPAKKFPPKPATLEDVGAALAVLATQIRLVAPPAPPAPTSRPNQGAESKAMRAAMGLESGQRRGPHMVGGTLVLESMTASEAEAWLKERARTRRPVLATALREQMGLGRAGRPQLKCEKGTLVLASMTAEQARDHIARRRAGAA